jgi:two-component system, NtrC family, sensor kinase
MVFTALRGRERPMRRRANPAKSKVEAKPPVVRKSRTSEGSRVNDLEKRLAEALERETAAAEILRVISSSPTDAQPVFDAIAESAVRLCEGLYANVSTFDGRMLRYVAFHNVKPAAIAMLREKFPSPPTRGGSSGRAILDRAVVHIPDVSADPEYEFSDIASTANYRALVAVPMLRKGSPIGAINVARAQVGPFSDKHIELLQTFADQAVIAIENVRLFKELEARNAALTEALERQTATSEILRVISSSPTDLQPVFSTIVENAARLCDARFTALFRFDGELITVAVQHGSTPEELAVTRAVFPAPATRGTAAGRAILERGVVHIHDIRTDLEYGATAALEALGYRTALAVPMLRGVIRSVSCSTGGAR